MASSFTTLLRLEQMVQGEQSNTWGDITTDNLEKLEQGIAGYQDITLASSDYTLSTESGGDGGASDEAGVMIISSDSEISANINIIAPNVSKLYIINNETTGGSFTVSIKTSGGSAIEIPRDESNLVWCDGNNVFTALTAVSSGTIAEATNALQLGGVVAASYALLAVKQSFTKPQTVLGASIVLTTNAYTPNADNDTTMFLAQSEVGNDYTINNPTGTPINGQIFVFHLEQHNSTPRSVTWGSEYIFTDDTNVDVTQTVDTVDTFTCQYNANLDRWLMAGVAQNFPRA